MSHWIAFTRGVTARRRAACADRSAAKT